MSPWRYSYEREPLNTPIVIYGAIFEFRFIYTFIIDISERFLHQNIYIKETKLLIAVFEFNCVLHQWILTVQ